MIDLRSAICTWARWGVTNTLAIHYAEFRPMSLTLPRLPWTGDCSTAAREWFRLAGAPDPMGYGYANLAGNTQTLMVNGTQITAAEVGPADMVIYGTDELSTQHVSLIIGAGINPMTVSHGDEAGPLYQLVYADSRPKRYFRFVTSIAGDPPPTIPEDEVLFLAKSFNGPATLLYDVQAQTCRGVSADEATLLQKVGIKSYGTELDATVLATFKRIA